MAAPPGSKWYGGNGCHLTLSMGSTMYGWELDDALADDSGAVREPLANSYQRRRDDVEMQLPRRERKRPMMKLQSDPR